MAGLSRKRKALYSAMVFVALLVGAEVTLRAYNFSFYFNFGADMLGMPLLDLHSIRRVMNRTVDFDPHLFWSFKPDQTLDAKGIYRKPVHINSKGFRGEEFPEQKPKGTYRVACIGDSTTFGWSVGDDETYPYQLEGILKKDCRREVEVLNLGVTGYTSLQGRELMLLKVKDWDPDAVVFAFGANDRLPALKSDEEHLRDRTWDIGPVSVFLNRFQVYKLIKSGVVYVSNRMEGLSLDPATYIPKLKRKVSPEEYVENVEKVKDACEEIGAELIVIHVGYPSLPEDHVTQEIHEQAKKYGAALPSQWETWDGEEIVENIRSKTRTTAFDLRPLFSRSIRLAKEGTLDPERSAEKKTALGQLAEKDPWYYLMVDNGHPNEWGHEIIAGRLAEMLETTEAYKKLCLKGAEN